MRISTFYCFKQGDAAEIECAQQLQSASQSTSIRACSSTHQPWQNPEHLAYDDEFREG